MHHRTATQFLVAEEDFFQAALEWLLKRSSTFSSLPPFVPSSFVLIGGEGSTTVLTRWEGGLGVDGGWLEYGEWF